jgi:hypothetical protein
VIRQTAKLALLTTLCLLGASAGIHAQEHAETPSGWKIRLDGGDHGAGAAPSFVSMPPGWHITTGPAGIFYDPSQTASGEYRLEAETELFDPGNRREGYGILFGGSDLDGADQAYTYFLIRRDGQYLIKKREGSTTSVLKDWASHPAIVTWEGRGEGEGTAKNVLGVQVGASNVIFRVNGQDVVTLLHEGMPTEGIVGLRVNHSVNLHVTRLEVGQIEEVRPEQ